MVPLAEKLPELMGKIIRFETENPFQAVRRFNRTRAEAREVTEKLLGHSAVVRMGLVEADESEDLESELGNLRARRTELYTELANGKPGIRTVVVLFDDRLGKFGLGRRTLHEANRENTPRFEPLKPRKVHNISG